MVGNWNTHVSNGAFYKLSYDVVKDFEPLSLLASFSSIVAANKAVPAKDLKELISWLKAKPNGASQGSAGIGSGGHVTGIHFQNLTGAHFQHVPYRGSAPAMQDLIAGHVDVMIDAPVIILPQVRAGTIKAYAVTAKSRLASAHDIPTVDEAGVPGLYFRNWFALFAPSGTPPDVIAKLNAAVVETLADPQVRQRLADLGLEIPSRAQQTTEAVKNLQKDEIEKWWPLIRAAGFKQE
jgi:tripartite-type tricarboxylate transporter receptor subunit TctC